MTDSMRDNLDKIDNAQAEMTTKAKRTVRKAGQTADDASRQIMNQEPANTVLDTLENMSSQTYLTAVGGSIALSLLLYFMGKRGLAIFVGLWAPTILNLGLYNKMLHPSQD